MAKLLTSAVVLSVVFSSAATADTWVVGLGVDSVFDDDQDVAITVEYHGDPFFQSGRFSVGIGGSAEIDAAGDIFIGAGLTTLWDFADQWFIETSLMPGYYDNASDGTDLGGNIQFRSLIGVGYRISDRDAVSVAVDHKSNAGLDDINPGTETISLRYMRTF